MARSQVIVRYQPQAFALLGVLCAGFAVLGWYLLTGRIDWGWRQGIGTWSSFLCSALCAIGLARLIRIKGILLIGHSWGLEIRPPALSSSNRTNFKPPEKIKWSVDNSVREGPYSSRLKVRTLRLRCGRAEAEIPLPSLLVNGDCLERLEAWKQERVE